MSPRRAEKQPWRWVHRFALAFFLLAAYAHYGGHLDDLRSPFSFISGWRPKQDVKKPTWRTRLFGAVLEKEQKTGKAKTDGQKASHQEGKLNGKVNGMLNGMLNGKSTGKADGKGHDHMADAHHAVSGLKDAFSDAMAKIQNKEPDVHGPIVHWEEELATTGMAPPQTTIAYSGQGATPDERKIRSAIESILRDQDNMRESTKLSSFRTYWVSIGVATLAVLASGTAALPTWCGALLPALTSVIFTTTSAAESSGVRSMGVAKYSSAQALSMSSQQEYILAQAEYRKAELPFLVGLTAIFAAACVTVKVLEERGGLGEDPSIGLVFAWGFLNFAFATASLAGAIKASDLGLRLQAALSQDRDESASEANEWESSALPKVIGEPEYNNRVTTAAATLGVCVIASLATIGGFGGISEIFSMPREEVQEKIGEFCVVLSAVAAAQAALVYLVAEKDFADAERRVAILAKQAALSEMFAAQSSAEAAQLPVRTAISGAALGGAAAAVELSHAAAMLAPWPAMFATLRSTVGAVLAGVEADATWLERRSALQGRNKDRKSDSIASSFRELERVQEELFQPDVFSQEVRDKILTLPPGDSREFMNLSLEKRRKVHITAAELGLKSKSYGTDKRVVVVTNPGVDVEVLDPEDTSVNTVVDDLREEIRALFEDGLPPGSERVVLGAAFASFLAVLSPVAFGRVVAELVLPLATGSIGLLTVYQESQGKKTVALVKEQAAKALNIQADAEVQLGLCATTSASLPTLFAIATCAATASITGFEGAGTIWGTTISISALFVALVAQIIVVDRQRRISRLVRSAVKDLGGVAPPQGWLQGRRWMILPSVAFILPLDWPRKVSVCAALLAMQVGLVMACCAEQMAAGHHFAGRYTRGIARVDAWSQQASGSIRALPFGSAAAVVNTLLATAFVTFSAPLATIFPVAGFGVWVRSVQFAWQADKDAKKSNAENQNMQKPESPETPPWLRTDKADKDVGAASSNSAGGRSPAVRTRTTVVPVVNAKVIKETKKRRAVPAFRWRRMFNRFLVLWKEAGPEDTFKASPAEVAVESVQADLDELRSSSQRREKSWTRVGITVAVGSAAAVLAPLVLPALAVEVILPVAGAGLTLFAVSAESDARRQVAASKVWAAELGNAQGVAQELCATAVVYRARLLGAMAVSTIIAMLTVILEHPMHHSFILKFMVGAQVFLTSWGVLPMLGTMNWAQRAARTDAVSLRNIQGSGVVLTGMTPSDSFGAFPWEEQQRLATQRKVRRLSILATFPVVLPLIFGQGSFARRAVVSTAAGAFVLTLSVYLAERACAVAEKSVATRQRVHALADTFANEAEQQGALLPAFSALTIAISAGLTFVTELNPYVASSLTFFQAVTWLLASRKAQATKVESSAALQVDEKATSDQMGSVGSVLIGQDGSEPRANRAEVTRRVKRFLIG